MSFKSHISLFTGAGGLDLGVEYSGFTTLVAVEKDTYARWTLDSNRGHFQFPDFELLEDASDVTGEDLLTAAGVRRGELDLLSGGPPCQSFSTAGHRKSMADPRGSLLGRFIQLVDEVQPRFFILENVRGVLSAALSHRPLARRGPGHPPLSSDEQAGGLLRRIILPSIKVRLGYQVSHGLINAADYGVPQVRQRVIFIGSRDHELADGSDEPDLGQLVRATHAKQPSGGLSAWRTLGDALQGLPRSDSERVEYSPARGAVLQRVPEGRNWRYLRDNFGEDYLKSVMGGAYSSSGGRVGFWRRLRFDKPCPTVVASPVQKATSLCHPTETRPLSVREYARVQQFPDDYSFVGSTSSKYTQIGNAVPVGLAQAIGNAVVLACDPVPEAPIRRRTLSRRWLHPKGNLRPSGPSRARPGGRRTHPVRCICRHVRSLFPSRLRNAESPADCGRAPH